MTQAVLRVCYSVLKCKYEEKTVKPKKKRLSEDAWEEKVGIEAPSEISMSEVCSHLDINEICGVFMALLSQRYLNEKSVVKN